MRHLILRSMTVGAVATLALGACSSGPNSSGSAKGRTPFIGVILPDTKSSARWETQDKPALTAAFKAKDVRYDIQNALGDKTKFGRSRTRCSKRASTSWSSSTSTPPPAARCWPRRGRRAWRRSTTTASRSVAAPTTTSASTTWTSATLQGQSLAQCLHGTTKPVVAELNGSPTDNNATLFAQGYNSVLNLHYADGSYIKGPNMSTTDWKNDIAGKNFEQMLAQAPNISGVLVANDGMAQAVIGVLQKHHLNGKVQVTGQDATVPGLQSVLVGDQCMTVFKDSVAEANAGAELAYDLATGRPASSATAMVADTVTGKLVKSVMLTPEAIVKSNINDVIAAGAVTKAQVCTPKYAAACAEAGIK